MNFGTIMLNQSTMTKQNYVIWMDTDNSVLIMFTEDFFEDINNDVERWFYTSNYDENDKRPLQIGVNKKVIGMFKDELVAKIIKNSVYLELKHTYV